MSLPQRGEVSSRTSVEHFNQLYSDAFDPWDYASSDYEQRKYRQTLDLLPAQTGRTLELGCSIGVFTQLLAPRCESLLAIDFSPAAVDRARQRLAAHSHVEIVCAALPEATPPGPFDTIVCAELLYYWSPALVVDGLRKSEAALAPGGSLLAVHWRGKDPRRELAGDDVHQLLLDETRLRWQAGDQTPDYLIDLWSAE